MADEIIQVVTTTADKQDAETLAQALLTKRLAGCVQVSGPITSSYWWNNRIETGTEYTCIVKTIRSLYAEVEQVLLDLHPYDQPEILAVAVSDVSPGYAQWLREQVQPEYPAEPSAPQLGDATAATETHASQPLVSSAETQPADATSTEHPAPAADVTPAQAAAMIPAAGLAAASQSNVPQAMPFAAGNVEAPGAITEQLAAAPEAVSDPSEQPESAESERSSTAAKTPAKSKRAPRKKSPKPSA